MLTAISRINKTGRSYWLCRCDCGKEYPVEASNLIRLKIVSCGCYRDSEARKRSTRHGKAKKTINNIWCGIKQRTRNPNCNEYKYYGARGIDMCDEWYSSFLKFYEDVGDPPFPRASLDRIDNSKGYFKGNVQWATMVQQGNNKRNNVVLTSGGEAMTVAQWSRKTGVGATTISARIANGWPVDEAVNLPASPIARSKRIT